MKFLQSRIFLLFMMFLLAVGGVFAQKRQAASNAAFLEGLWQREGKEEFEKWEKSEGVLFKGRGYRVKNGQEETTERLEIKNIGGKLVYLATVSDQNKGETVKFHATTANGTKLVFENRQHDFPKRIAYKKLSDTEIFVEVTGSAGQGFSFKMKKLTEVALTQEFIEAFNKRKIEKMMSLVAPNIKWMTIAGDKIRTETDGGAQLQSFLESYFKICPSCRSEIKNLSQTGNRVTLTERATWQTATGAKSNESIAVYEFDNGKIVRVFYYAEPSPSSYDEKLSKRLGADARGMKTFVLVWLKSGSVKLEKDERAKLIQGHMENIGRLAESGKLVLAGPFMEKDNLRGLYVFDVRTKEEAAELVLTDPAVKAGAFEVELRLWYGSAALLELNGIHQLIQKKENSK